MVPACGAAAAAPAAAVGWSGRQRGGGSSDGVAAAAVGRLCARCAGASIGQHLSFATHQAALTAFNSAVRWEGCAGCSALERCAGCAAAVGCRAQELCGFGQLAWAFMGAQAHSSSLFFFKQTNQHTHRLYFEPKELVAPPDKRRAWGEREARPARCGGRALCAGAAPAAAPQRALTLPPAAARRRKRCRLCTERDKRERSGTGCADACSSALALP